MMILLLLASLGFFIAHILLIFTSFGKKGYQPQKYFWSHSTLWLAGIILSIALWKYSGKQEAVAINAFDTPFKKTLPVIVAFTLSLIAHLVVKFLVLPTLTQNQERRQL
ncbi:MAG: hypothetical protein H7Y03_13770 [Chitinophagaceae bacterium]|nr:hypothetical protein [Chitinophagaceae bacterium]